jgi:probable addiction module antidote protein
MHTRKYRTAEEVHLEYFKKHPEEIKGYLAVALEEYQKDGHEKAFLYALSFAAKVHGGFTKLSKQTGLNRENLYRALSKDANPRLSTIRRVMGALGYSLTIK